MNGSERTYEKTTAHLHCMQGLRALFSKILGTIWIVSSQTLDFEMYISLIDEHFSLNVGQEQWTSKLYPFHISMNIFGGTGTL